MSRQDANAIFAHTSFLYGGNAAYIEDLYARYEADPAAVDAEWRAFFQSLKDEKPKRKSAERFLRPRSPKVSNFLRPMCWRRRAIRSTR